jgi:hypothetical protein
LSNEASRQRSIEATLFAQAFHNPKKIAELSEEASLVHGEYTENFYKNQLKLLKTSQGR